MGLERSRSASRHDVSDAAGAQEAGQGKHTLHLPTKLWGALDQRAKTWGISKSEALRRAVWLLTAIGDRLDEGSEVVVRDKNGREDPLIISPAQRGRPSRGEPSPAVGSR